MFGGSGGGPHALACAALLGKRVTLCAVLSGIRPRRDEKEERSLRPKLAATAEIYGRIYDWLGG